MIYMYLEEPLRAVKASSEILFHQNIEIKGINSTQAYVLIQSKWLTNCIENDFIGVNFHLFLRICNKNCQTFFYLLLAASLFPFFSSFSLLLKKIIHVFFVNNHLLSSLKRYMYVNQVSVSQEYCVYSFNYSKK